ncbi:MAG: phosphotransferase [Gammaproteobacteria bacterium]
MTETTSADVLTTAFSPVTVEQAALIARDFFAIEGTAEPLTSERDQNFRVSATSGDAYLLKISNPAEERTVTNFQTEALRHIALTNPALPVPRVLPAAGGDFEPLLEQRGEPARVVRLMTYMPGVPLNTVEDVPTKLRSNLGMALARLGAALRDFDHPAADHELMWDLKNTSSLSNLLEYVEEPADQRLARQFFERFEEYVRPQLGQLRSQVVHNDLNFYNVLVEEHHTERVTGIIDFGDMVRTPLICDVAVAAAYQLPADDDPLGCALTFIGAYHRTTALEPMETQLLFDLIATRLLMTVLITGWRAARYPDNSAYILRNNPAAWRNLRYFARTGHDVGIERICAVCS